MRRRRTVPPITIPTDSAALGYIAGLVDGEGNINISTAFCVGKSKSLSYHARVVITNTNELLMVWLLESLGGTIENRRHRKPNWKPSWNWAVYGDNAASLLKAIKPYLVIKKDQATLAMQLRSLQKIRGKKTPDAKAQTVLANIKADMNRLNARGVEVIEGHV